MQFITMDLSKCIVCRNCEYACAYVHGGDFNRSNSNIRVEYYAEAKICLPMTCLQCQDAWCLEVCPAAAITKNPQSGAVEINQDRCVGCKMCILYCPFGNIHFDDLNQVSRKCDLCNGEPQCVAHCISGALNYVSAEDSNQNNREAFKKFIESMANENGG